MILSLFFARPTNYRACALSVFSSLSANLCRIELSEQEISLRRCWHIENTLNSSHESNAQQIKTVLFLYWASEYTTHRNAYE